MNERPVVAVIWRECWKGGGGGGHTLPYHQPCPLDDRRPQHPSQNMPEVAPRILLLAPLTSVMPSGVQMTPVLTYYSRECVVPLGPWKNFVIFGRRGASL